MVIVPHQIPYVRIRWGHFVNWIYIMEDNKLCIEISIAYGDEDFDHMGYYNNVEDAIEALLRFKNKIKYFI